MNARIPGLIDISGQLFVRPEAVLSVAARASYKPWLCRSTGTEFNAFVLIETAGEKHRVSCLTMADAKALAADIASKLQLAAAGWLDCSGAHTEAPLWASSAGTPHDRPVLREMALAEGATS